MSNYGIITDSVLCRNKCKNERFPARKKRKTAITAVSIVTDILGRDKRLSKWLENCVATKDNVS